ncbi:ATPaselike protein [Acanthamoeba castellanii str. Neff]|uniref:Bis(5'-adenosyl)-triphosphatase n=1 Tax=Acanthamoeba castellanii (strain ATCC 30010 / Neff) TaxID=1257118 RepID=L8HDI0_ACACF|nr:ATPaselike protein [Acanthamoeba castellanii str. Neff]ELR22818.1 ATPaselike protein [Acanthamoeba castellanii str. Neff]
MMAGVVETIAFGQHNVRASQIFFRSSLSYGLVNLMPLVPGHVLVISQRRVARFRDLTPPEVSDLWTSAQRIGEVVERHYKGDALTMAIQDGAAAGQTVSHVHIHVIPRRRGDFARNDEVYERLDMDKDRTKRTEEEMAEEAALLARYFDDGNSTDGATSP